MNWSRPLARFLKRDKKLPRAEGDDVRLVQLLDHNGVDGVIDIGANEGQYARRVRAAGYGGAILSFEPGSTAHAALCRAAAGDAAWEVAPPLAMGAQAGRATLHVSERSDMSSLLMAGENMGDIFPKVKMGAREEVDVRRLDNVFGPSGRPLPGDHNFVKIDTQGYEDAIIKGARGILDRVVGFQIEMSLVSLYRDQPSMLDIMTAMRDLGYELHYLMDGFFSRRLARQVEIDGIFFRATPAP